MGHNLFVTLVCIRWLGLSNTDQVSDQLSSESALDYNIDINILITCTLLQILMTNLLSFSFLRIRDQTLTCSLSECSIRTAAAIAGNVALLSLPACPWTLTSLAPGHLTATGTLLSITLFLCQGQDWKLWKEEKRRCFCILWSLRRCENLPSPYLTILFGFPGILIRAE